MAESATVEEAIQNILKAICETLGWDLGELWIPEDSWPTPVPNSQRLHTQSLGCSNLWLSPSSQASELIEQLGQITFNLGVGLPGRIWETGSLHWITDIVDDPNFLRAESARKDGLHGAFGFPILDDREVLGVMTFYSHSIEQPDPDLIEKMENIGSQIGQFIRRKQTELKLKEAQDRLQAVMDNSTA
ncbi:MAG: hypothetical protein Fur006_18160 [Coleofasciculaceae cyanobacterium]